MIFQVKRPSMNLLEREAPQFSNLIRANFVTVESNSKLF